jgi:hypothetical protein
MGGEGTKVLKAYVLLSTDLEDTCILLRSLSLQMPHAPGQPVMSNGTEFPTMQMSVRLESSGDVMMPRPKQVSLLEQLTWLNHIGKITIIGSTDEKGKTPKLLQYNILTCIKLKPYFLAILSVCPNMPQTWLEISVG